MKDAKTLKNLKEIPYPPHKTKLLKRKGNSINAPISQTSSECLKLTI